VLRVFMAAIGLLCSAIGCADVPPAAGSVTAVSEGGALEAQVDFEGGVTRGENTLVIHLRALKDDTTDMGLDAVDALMAAHAHEAHAESVTAAGSAFRASRLDLFMTGRWQIELGLSSAESSDLVSFPIDVP
jgi:hypothetical protein